jgi:hypothetical protein
MVRNFGDEPTLVHDLRVITLHNLLVRCAAPVGTARSKKGDVGAMHGPSYYLMGSRCNQLWKQSYE